MSKEKIIEFINPNLLASEENLKLNIDDENGEPRGSFNKLHTDTKLTFNYVSCPRQW